MMRRPTPTLSSISSSSSAAIAAASKRSTTGAAGILTRPINAADELLYQHAYAPSTMSYSTIERAPSADRARLPSSSSFLDYSDNLSSRLNPSRHRPTSGVTAVQQPMVQPPSPRLTSKSSVSAAYSPTAAAYGLDSRTVSNQYSTSSASRSLAAADSITNMGSSVPSAMSRFGFSHRLGSTINDIVKQQTRAKSTLTSDNNPLPSTSKFSYDNYNDRYQDAGSRYETPSQKYDSSAAMGNLSLSSNSYSVSSNPPSGRSSSLRSTRPQPIAQPVTQPPFSLYGSCTSMRLNERQPSASSNAPAPSASRVPSRTSSASNQPLASTSSYATTRSSSLTPASYTSGSSSMATRPFLAQPSSQPYSSSYDMRSDSEPESPARVSHYSSGRRDLNLSADSLDDSLNQSYEQRSPDAMSPSTSTTGYQSQSSSTTVLSTRFSYSKKIRSLVGLQNLGNTCFLNSCLQCLCSTPPLIAYFKSNQWSQHLSSRSPTKGSLARAFAELIRMTCLGRDDDVFSPSDIKRLVASYAPRFLGYNQQDSQEFLRFLLDGLHEDLNLIQHTPKYEAIQDLPHDSLAVRSNRWWKNYTDRNDSFIVDLFAGQLQSTLTCLECDHKSIVYDPFWDLSLPLSSSGKSSMSYSAGVKLDDCFRFFTTPETLQGDDMPYCSKCKTHRASTKKMELYRFPDVLVVHLKRFAVGRYGGRGDKLTTNVDFPLENLDLSEFAAPGALASAGSSAAVYDLFAISNHMGSLGGGHYTAHAKTGADSWSTFNDSRVSPVSTSSLGGSSAYVLFFHRKK